MRRLAGDGKLTCGEIHAMMVDHLAGAESKIGDIRRIERILEAIAAECLRGETPDRPIIATLFEVAYSG